MLVDQCPDFVAGKWDGICYEPCTAMVHLLSLFLVCILLRTRIGFLLLIQQRTTSQQLRPVIQIRTRCRPGVALEMGSHVFAQFRRFGTDACKS
jgi:hypothetical protein